MQINLDAIISSIYGIFYGGLLALILVPLYSWGLCQRENLRIMITVFVAVLGPFFMILSKKTGEVLMISEGDDLSGYFFASVGIGVFIIYGRRLKIFSRRPNGN